jgi:hypothetical protein
MMQVWSLIRDFYDQTCMIANAGRAEQEMAPGRGLSPPAAPIAAIRRGERISTMRAAPATGSIKATGGVRMGLAPRFW